MLSGAAAAVRASKLPNERASCSFANGMISSHGSFRRQICSVYFCLITVCIRAVLNRLEPNLKKKTQTLIQRTICNFWGSEFNVLGLKKVDLSSLLFTNLTAAALGRADVSLFQMFSFSNAGGRLQLEGKCTWGEEGKRRETRKVSGDWFHWELKVLLTSHLVLFADFPNFIHSSITLWELYTVFTWTTAYGWQGALQEYQSNLINSTHWADRRAQLHRCGSRMSLTLCWTVKQI